MAGSKQGGLLAAATNKRKYGKDFYSRIGAAGGKLGHTGGFWNDPERARLAGIKGGKASKPPDTKILARGSVLLRRLYNATPETCNVELLDGPDILIAKVILRSGKQCLLNIRTEHDLRIRRSGTGSRRAVYDGKDIVWRI